MPPKPQVSAVLSLKAADEGPREVTAGTVTTLSAVLTSKAAESLTIPIGIEVTYTSTYPGEGAEWPVRWTPPGKRTPTELFARKVTHPLTILPGTGVPLSFEITAPVGVRYGDRVEIRLTAHDPDGSPAPPHARARSPARRSSRSRPPAATNARSPTPSSPARTRSRTSSSRSSSRRRLRGYVFAEGMSFEGVREMLKGIRKARGLVDGETTLKEVEPLLVPKITVEGFVEGAIVELISGPFKGEKARVKKIDQAKEEITVELIEAVVPIPVTVRGDHVRMLEKGGGKSGG